MQNTAHDTTSVIYAYIKAYFITHGYPASVREIADGCCIGSTSTVKYHMDKLFKLGLLETDSKRGSPRAYRVAGYGVTKLEEGGIS